MNGLILANPRRKSRRKSSRKVRRNPIANLGSYAKKKSSRRSSRRRSTSRALAAAPVATRKSPVRRRSSRRRRSGGNFVSRAGRSVSRSVSSGLNGLISELPAAATGAVGALGVDLAWGYLPLPANLKTGPLAPVARMAGAVGVGLLAGAVMGKKFGRTAMLGAMTVTVTDLAKGFLKAKTSLPLSYYPARGLSYYPLGCPPGRGLSYYPAYESV